MTDRELMQQALDALQEYVAVVVSVNDPNDWTPKVADAGEPARKAIEALRARLAQPDLITPADVEQLARIEKLIDKINPYEAQPEQEPVAWMHPTSRDCVSTQSYSYKDAIPLYAAPPQREWQGLAIDEIEASALLGVYAKPLIEFARAIEAKLKEKNNGR